MFMYKQDLALNPLHGFHALNPNQVTLQAKNINRSTTRLGML